MSVADRLADVRGRIEQAARRAGRDPSEVRLVAVGKGAPLEAVREAYAAGQRDFGENRADALAERAAALPEDARWHFIGNVQRNKLRVLRERASLVHSFDRPDLAPRWGALPFLVQVDFTGRSDRNGVPLGEIPAVLDRLAAHGISARGLSTLPSPGQDPRDAFRALRSLREALAPRWPGLRELSMGMSDDFEVAIEEGATLVRVGRALFG